MKSIWVRVRDRSLQLSDCPDRLGARSLKVSPSPVPFAEKLNEGFQDIGFKLFKFEELLLYVIDVEVHTPGPTFR